MDLKPIAEAAGLLAKPVEAAINNVSAGVGRIYEPTHLRRVAKAQADARFIETLGKQDVEELTAAYENREKFRKARKQLNLGLIADRVAERLHDTPPAQQQTPDDEWVDEFEEHAERANSPDLQELWARLMAGEIKKKGSVPRRVLRRFRDLDQRTALLFQEVCNCTFVGKARLFVNFEGFDGVCNFNFLDLKELASLELLEIPAFAMTAKLEAGSLRFHNRVLQFSKAKEGAKDLQMFIFTRIGEVLANVCDTVPNERYFGRVTREMMDAGWNFTCIALTTGPGMQ